MRLRTVLLAAVVMLGVTAHPAASGGLMTSPGGTTPGGAIFDGLRGTTTRPVPRVSPAPAPAAPDTWVPDRYVLVPGVDGHVLVPAAGSVGSPTTRSIRHRWSVRLRMA